MGTVFLIPTVLHEEGLQALPAYILDTARSCAIFFVENERTARRFLKQLDRSFVIDNYQWVNVGDSDAAAKFRLALREGKKIGILSEAGCPGVADPGQTLVAIAQESGATVKPLVGPNSILLALMASGMNGQQFRFCGYLPIDSQQRARSLRELEQDSRQRDCTEIFIETPYRNNQLLEAILKSCASNTQLCIAADLTAPSEFIQTRSVKEWDKQKPDLHKRPVIFLLYAGK